MTASISSTTNLINMISLSYPQTGTASQASQAPPPPPAGQTGASPDPLGVFDTVDSDGDGSISEPEYNLLLQGIAEITGTELENDFLDFDSDGDGALNGPELKAVLDKAGFAPPPPPPDQVISAYGSQADAAAQPMIQDADLLSQLLEYLENNDTDLDITA